VPLPQRLLADLRDTPLALGVYALVARVYRATKADVPLSAGDLRRYDPGLSIGAAGRALDRLVKAGYLEQVPAPGRRNVYRPAWGLVNGAPRAWALEAACLGRPPHIKTLRLPQELLDRYMGRLEPNARQGAHVARYTTVPLLGLADVGAYGLAMAGYRPTSPGLEAAGLLIDGQPLPLPDAKATLALVSQRRLFDAGSPIALTPAGLTHLGLPAAPREEPQGDPLLFLPPEQAGALIGRQIAPSIGSGATPAATPTAVQRPRGRAVPPCPGSHGILSKKGEESTHYFTVEHGGGGGEHSLSQARTGASGHGTTAKETAARHGAGATTGEPASPNQELATESEATAQGEAERQLRQLGVRADVARSLGDRPVEQVRRVIAEARSRPNIRNRAAWVVSALRALPAEEPAPPPKASDMAILVHPGLTHLERTRWLARFRNADPFERATVLAHFHAEHPLESA